MRVSHCFTTTPLAAAGVYASAWQLVTIYPRVATDTDIPVAWDRQRVRGIIAADQNSAVNGVIIQFSQDGTNVVAAAPPQTLVAGVPILVDVLNYGKYVRVSFQNGAVVQGTFSLYLWLVEED